MVKLIGIIECLQFLNLTKWVLKIKKRNFSVPL